MFRNSGPLLPGLRTNELKLAIEQGYILRHPEPDTAAAFRKCYKLTCDLWNDEQVAGQRLLEPEVYEGVLHNTLLQRKVLDMDSS